MAVVPHYTHLAPVRLRQSGTVDSVPRQQTHRAHVALHAENTCITRQEGRSQVAPVRVEFASPSCYNPHHTSHARRDTGTFPYTAGPKDGPLRYARTSNSAGHAQQASLSPGMAPCPVTDRCIVFDSLRFPPLPSLALFTASLLYGIPTSVARYRVQLVTL